ncbi:DUF3817 domain-containing protein [Microbispora bryophytorum]|uniref:DUF3817 domain-containing protein n=1 Tax=Microbispora bryophytorum subsp. camponoti TaxID=1677852 RepID=A0ABR8L294_9ACTN|nr:DUF3817 domain-containing protein [Microbispora camponoti]MBD3143605.1 DUF3817 domain-containing protein [Microbispora camponoti]
MSRPHSALRVAAAVELGSLAVLLANLATVHLPPVSSLVGPLHGCAYLVVVVAAARDAGCDLTGKALAWLPGIGGLLVLRRLARTPRAKAAAGSVS